MVYADNAATTQLDPDAFEAMKYYLLNEFGNASQPYSFSRNPRKALAEARETIAECIGASANEIYFTSGGTESDNWAINSVIGNSRKTIVTSQIEHHAILNSCQMFQSLGGNVISLPVDREGLIHLQSLEEVLSDGIALVSIMAANNEIGTIEPIRELAELAHKKGALFHTDAVQAVGHIPINVKNLNVDMLSASAHKFNGPKGIGFLYVKNGVDISPMIHGGKQENAKRAGTENIAAIVAMAVALRNNCNHLEQTGAMLNNISKLFLDKLKSLDVDYILNGSTIRIPGNINISIKNASGEMILHRLDLMNIYISTGAACDSKDTNISHVIKAIDVPEEYAKGTIRISFGKSNTEADAITVATKIGKIVC